MSNGKGLKRVPLFWLTYRHPDGRAAGVVVNMGGSTMGQGAAIRLRGNVSVSQSNQPLVYVDGVKQTTDAYPRAVSRLRALAHENGCRKGCPERRRLDRAEVGIV